MLHDGLEPNNCKGIWLQRRNNIPIPNLDELRHSPLRKEQRGKIGIRLFEIGGEDLCRSPFDHAVAGSAEAAPKVKDGAVEPYPVEVHDRINMFLKVIGVFEPLVTVDKPIALEFSQTAEQLLAPICFEIANIAVSALLRSFHVHPPLRPGRSDLENASRRILCHCCLLFSHLPALRMSLSIPT